MMNAYEYCKELVRDSYGSDTEAADKAVAKFVSDVDDQIVSELLLRMETII